MKSLIVTIISIAALGLLALTNPKMPDYEQFVRNQVAQKTEKADDLTKILGMLFGGVASGLITNSTTRADYVFFSLYDTRLDNDKFKVIGVLNNFVILQQPNPEHAEQGQPSTIQENTPVSQTRFQALNDPHAAPVRALRVDYFPAKEGQWPPIIVDAVDGQQPQNVVRQIEKPQFLKLLGDDYDEFASFIAVGTEVKRDRDYLVGSGCTAHDCADKPGIFVIEIKTGRVFAAIIDSDKVKAWGVDQAVDLPYPILVWLAKNKLTID